MKTLKMLLLIAIMTFSSTVSASTTPSVKADEPDLISKTVSKLLQNPYFKLNEDIQASVEIAINKDNEIVVLLVDTKNKKVETFIKNRLNYKKIPKDLAGNLKYYRIPVKMLKSE